MGADDSPGGTADLARAVRAYVACDVPGALALLEVTPALRDPAAAPLLRALATGRDRTIADDIALDIEERVAYLELAREAGAGAPDRLFHALSSIIDADDLDAIMAVLQADQDLAASAGRRALLASLAAMGQRLEPEAAQYVAERELLVEHAYELRERSDGQRVAAARPPDEVWRRIEAGIERVGTLRPLVDRERWGAACADVSGAISRLVAGGEVERQRWEDVTDATASTDEEDADHPAAVHLELATRYLALPADADEGRTIERAVAALERAKALAQDAGDGLRARIALHLGAAHSRQLTGDRSQALSRSIEELERARSLLPAGDDRAAALSNLALALLEHVTPTRARDIERAIGLLQEAGQTWAALAIRGRWAGAQHNLGVAYSKRIQGDRFENQERAIDAYRQALTVSPRGGGIAGRTLIEWAATLSNLASALTNRGQGTVAEDVERAIALLRLSLLIRTRDVHPVDWAITQHNLGVAYSERETGFPAANIERAIGHLDAALEERRRDTRTADWVDTTLTLGAVLVRRGRGDPADNRRRAVALYESALDSVDAAAAPLAFAALRTNLANVAVKQFEAGECATLDRAEQAHADALDE